MSEVQPGFSPDAMEANIENLFENPYPGRGIILGRSADNHQARMAYWVTGRSPHSRNRILAEDGDTVRTEPFDPSKVEDPSLIIYNAMRTRKGRHHETLHIISNGDQTDSVYAEQGVAAGNDFTDNFRNALLTREFEPDPPNFTPRISGAIEISGASRYHYSIIRRHPDTGRPEHSFGSGSLEDIPPGTGLCFHTYDGDGDPLPSFSGSPYAVPLPAETTGATAEGLWEMLDAENRVALAVRDISVQTGLISNTHIINQLAS